MRRRSPAHSKCPVNKCWLACLKSGSTTDSAVFDAGKQCSESRAGILPGSGETWQSPDACRRTPAGTGASCVRGMSVLWVTFQPEVVAVVA